MNLSTCTRHIMTSHFFKEIELTIICVNMVEMTKTVLEYYCVLYDCWKPLILGKYTSSSESPKLRCCYKNVKVGILHFFC